MAATERMPDVEACNPEVYRSQGFSIIDICISNAIYCGALNIGGRHTHFPLDLTILLLFYHIRRTKTEILGGNLGFFLR